MIRVLLCHTSLPVVSVCLLLFFFFFFNDTATTEIYTLSLHDALPISAQIRGRAARRDVHRRQGARGPQLHRRSQSHRRGDRKSTRLNSSHSQISYAVFCLKKKKKKKQKYYYKKIIRNTLKSQRIKHTT